MICFEDMTFCSAACKTTECRRHWSDAKRLDANLWWGKDGAPVAFSDFSDRCIAYDPDEDAPK